MLWRNNIHLQGKHWPPHLLTQGAVVLHEPLQWLTVDRNGKLSPRRGRAAYLGDKVEQGVPRERPNSQAHKQLQDQPVALLTAVEEDQRGPEHGAQREQRHGHRAVAVFCVGGEAGRSGPAPAGASAAEDAEESVLPFSCQARDIVECVALDQRFQFLRMKRFSPNNPAALRSP